MPSISSSFIVAVNAFPIGTTTTAAGGGRYLRSRSWTSRRQIVEPRLVLSSPTPSRIIRFNNNSNNYCQVLGFARQHHYETSSQLSARQRRHQPLDLDVDNDDDECDVTTTTEDCITTKFVTKHLPGDRIAVFGGNPSKRKLIVEKKLAPYQILDQYGSPGDVGSKDQRNLVKKINNKGYDVVYIWIRYNCHASRYVIKEACTSTRTRFEEIESFAYIR